MSLISGKYLKTAAIFWCACLTVFVIAFMFVLKPQTRQLSGLESELKNLETTIETLSLNADESAVRELQKQTDQMKEQLARFVVPSRDAIQILASIEISKLSKEVGLDAFIDPWNSGEIPAFSECRNVFGQSIKVRFNATFNEFAKFLNKLERYKSVIFIDSFSITRSREENAKPAVDLNLVVLVEKLALPKNTKS